MCHLNIILDKQSNNLFDCKKLTSVLQICAAVAPDWRSTNSTRYFILLLCWSSVVYVSLEHCCLFLLSVVLWWLTWVDTFYQPVVCSRLLPAFGSPIICFSSSHFLHAAVIWYKHCRATPQSNRIKGHAFLFWFWGKSAVLNMNINLAFVSQIDSGLLGK